MTDLSDIAIAFCRDCLKQTNVRTMNGSHLIYTREGRFNPADLNNLMLLVEGWCRQNKSPITISYIIGLERPWRVVASIEKFPFNIASQSSNLSESIMDVCIEAQKTLEAA